MSETEYVKCAGKNSKRVKSLGCFVRMNVAVRTREKATQSMSMNVNVATKYLKVQ